MKKWISILLILGCSAWLKPAEVYLVIGSDTAIWDGMNTGRHDDFYRTDTFTNPTANIYEVMSPEFRAGKTDSYGQELKLTWWMMAGNVFRYATNVNVPVPNIMTLYLMKTYHGEDIARTGDELTLHYHTFAWTDATGNGIYYWNEAPDFSWCREDFDVTLSQFLLEEQTFPVSFRSGWHYMGNIWQNYLSHSILPFSLHNDYPVHGLGNGEPLTNIYDWSQASHEFVPFKVDMNDYQKAGDGPGWNVRSAHFYSVLAKGLMDTVFAAAAAGTDQVACFWGHLPETDFTQNLVRIDSVAHLAATRYPGVNFRYCTAVEAMQRWLGTDDTQAPTLNFSTVDEGGMQRFSVSSDEEIFQDQPFVTVKDKYELTHVLSMTATGSGQWISDTSMAPDSWAKAAVAVCDTVGNQSLAELKAWPDIIYIDDGSSDFQTLHGSAAQRANDGWLRAYSEYSVTPGDSAVFSCSFTPEQQRMYRIEMVVGAKTGPDITLQARLDEAGGSVPLELAGQNPEPGKWNTLCITELPAGSPVTLHLSAALSSQASGAESISPDVVKISPFVREREISFSDTRLDLGFQTMADTLNYTITVRNGGYEELTVNSISSEKVELLNQTEFPLHVAPLSEMPLTVRIVFPSAGSLDDTLLINSDDPLHPIFRLPLNAVVKEWVNVVDNSDDNYSETGTWSTSVTQAWGNSSRFAYLKQNPPATAKYSFIVPDPGFYDAYFIVPKTVNSASAAGYEIRLNNVIMDTVIMNQNTGSGEWIRLTRLYAPAEGHIDVRVMDLNRVDDPAGTVLRGDAVKLEKLTTVSGIDDGNKPLEAAEFTLHSLYPNPFNNTVNFPLSLGRAAFCSIRIFDITGRCVSTPLDAVLPAGEHVLAWTAQNESGMALPSGLYFSVVRMNDKVFRQKMTLLK